MSNLPAAGYLSNAARTEAEMQAALELVRDVLEEVPGGSAAPVVLTIAAGVVVPPIRTCSYYISSEGGAGVPDTLTHIDITNTRNSGIVIMTPTSGHPITFGNAAGGSGQLLMRDNLDYVTTHYLQAIGFQRRGTNWWEIFRNVTAGPQNKLLYEYNAPAFTHGGTFTTGAWRTRPLNAEILDRLGRGALSANQITLLPGKYFVSYGAAGYKVNGHRTAFYNVTDATFSGLGGSSVRAGATEETMNWSYGYSYIDITAAKVFELQHVCQTTRNTDGMGLSLSLGTDLFAKVEITVLE